MASVLKTLVTRLIFLQLVLMVVAVFYHRRGFSQKRQDYRVARNTNSSILANGTSRQRASSVVTVVTAYYQVPSEHSKADYIRWIQTFLRNIPCFLVVFTDATMMPLLASFRENFMDRTEFVVLPFEDLPTFKLLSVWKEHYLFDPEAERHTIENYILWNNKINFGTEAIKLNPFKSSYFVWCDIGSFRQPQFVRRYVNFPSPTKVAKHGKDRMTFMSYMPIRKEEYLIDNTTGLPAHDFLRDYRIHCPVFTGHQKAWDQYARLFYSTLRLFIQSGRFAGKDQNIVTSVSVMYPNSTTLIRPKKFFGHIGSYFHYYFS